MDTVEKIIHSSETFYDDLLHDENGRYKSWEHCYTSFFHARGNTTADLDYLSLQLAFYLASWGMYRGSSFLLQKDYKVHLPIVRELLKPQYDILMGIDCSELKKDQALTALLELSAFIIDYYDRIRREVKGYHLKNQLSDTLITKILMGTLGCVPAYDRYFIVGIKHHNIASGVYNQRSILQLIAFYEENADRLEAVRQKMRVYDLPYPQMKILDIGFWQIGFELDTV